MITVIAGGVGAARLLTGLVQVIDPAELTVIVNVADDMVMHGLSISPDLDTITYTLAGEIDPERGWGLAGETWNAMGSLAQYGGDAWFNLGDRDLGTHLYRSQRIGQGASLSEVTAEIAERWSLGLKLLPVTDDPVRTRVTLASNGEEISFQEYFVQRHHEVAVSAVRFEGAEQALPAPGVLEAIESSKMVIIAPSNPLVSIDPVLAVPGVRAALIERRERCVAVSPIVAGRALKGPADRLMSELGYSPTVMGVGEVYAPVASVLVIDESDAPFAFAVEAAGIRVVVAPTIMSSPERAAALGATVLQTFDAPDEDAAAGENAAEDEHAGADENPPEDENPAE